MSRGKARYLVEWRSHEHEWNGREGKRFWRRDSADRCYQQAIDDGCWNVRLYEDDALIRADTVR